MDVSGSRAGAKVKRGAVLGSSRKKPVTRSVKAGLPFPVSRIVRYLKQGRYAQHIVGGSPIYLSAILDYLAGEVLELARNTAKDNKKSRITLRHPLLAVMSDDEIEMLLAGVTIVHGGVVPYIKQVLLPKNTAGKAAKSPKKTAEFPKKA